MRAFSSPLGSTSLKSDAVAPTEFLEKAHADPNCYTRENIGNDQSSKDIKNNKKKGYIN